jgi:NAD(P)-dependent dehydrogenase (short-subunit alcohol dehydrogenase family)
MESVAAMFRKSPHLLYGLDKLQLFQLDFIRLLNVRRMAQYIMKRERLDRLDILINTADMQPGPFDTDRCTGISTQMLVNHLGPLLFTISLLPLLERTARASDKNDVRIVHVNSTAHLDAPAPYRFKDITDYNKTFLNDENGDEYARYAHTKLADALFCCALQRLVDRREKPIIVIYPRAGAVTTGGTEQFHSGDESVFRPQAYAYPNRRHSRHHGAISRFY